MRPLLILPAVALLLAACGTNSSPDEQSPTPSVKGSQMTAQAPRPFGIGDSANITGSNGTPVKAILTGVLYADAHTKDYDGPDKYAVAVAFTLVALNATDKLPAPIEGHDFTWEKDGVQRASVDASNVPWTGCTNGYLPTSTLIRQQPRKVIVDLTTPAKGGTLTWNDEAGPVQWTLPEESKGHGTEPAAQYVTKYC